MSSFLQLISLVAILILAAKLLGWVAIRLGQPSVLGQLIAGLLLGPSLINIVELPFLADPHLADSIYHLAEIGVLLLMFLAGLELDIKDMLKNARVSAYAGVLGVIVPVVFGYGIGILEGMDASHAIFLGLTMGATSVSISAQTLFELKVLRSRVGMGLLGAAVFDDVLVILLLSIFTALSTGGGGAEILWTFLRMALFLVGASALGLYVLPWIAKKSERLRVSQSVLGIAMVVVLVFAVASEVLGGMAAITGSFIAGIMYGRTSYKQQIEHGFHAIAYAFFVPVFFVDIGLRVDLKLIPLPALGILALVIVLSILGKILGCGAGARTGGFSWRESLQLGIGMVSRGEVGLIIGSVGLSTGMLDQFNFSLIVGMVLATTLVTPPLLRWSFKGQPASAKEIA